MKKIFLLAAVAGFVSFTACNNEETSDVKESVEEVVEETQEAVEETAVEVEEAIDSTFDAHASEMEGEEAAEAHEGDDHEGHDH